MKITRSLFMVIFAAGFLPCHIVWAHTQGMSEFQPLAFGKFAMRNNDAAYSVIMSPGGVETYAPQILPFDEGQPAIFILDDFTPDTQLSITLADTVLTNVGGGPDFDLVDFTYTPDPAVTNGSGDLTLNVGATLRTDGSGILYEDGVYSGNYDLVITY